MFGIEHHAGRLVEARVASLTLTEEVAALNARFREIARRVDASQVIVCGDFRGLRTLSPEVADRIAEIFMAHNLHIERSAILCTPAHAEVCALLDRVVARANHPQRRLLRESADAIEWLSGVLTDDERNRLIDFLAPRRP